MKLNSTLLIIFSLIVILFITLIILIPYLTNSGSILRKCKFDERTSTYSKCYWIWQKELEQPSIYF
jgi:hypothetical protein